MKKAEKCDLCGSEMTYPLKTINYFGSDSISQKLVCCERCGLIVSDLKVPYTFNEMAIEKDDYLKKVIMSYIEGVKDRFDIASIIWGLSHKENEGRSYYETVFSSNNLLVISECLEHSTDLKTEMKTINDYNMKYVLIECPIYDLFSEKSIDLYGYFIKSHNYYYAVKTINYFMNELGYYLVDYKIEFGNDFAMPMVFPCLLGIWERRAENRIVMTSKADINEYLLLCDAKLKAMTYRLDELLPDEMPIALWGTGNYAEKLLAMSSLKRKNIKKIYDGNCKMHGCKFFGRIVSGFDKEDLNSGEIERIVIASNTSYIAIKNTLLKEYGVAERYIVTAEV